MSITRWSRIPGLWIAIGVLLLFWWTRTWSITAFPTFIDEVFHINFGAHVLQTGPLIHAEEGRQFTVWWFILFQSQSAAPVWIARIATTFVVLLGLAAFLQIGFLTSGLSGMILSGLVYLFSIYNLFFERLALADPISAAFVYTAVYFAYRLSRRIKWRDAALTGLCLFLAVGSKISALPYLCIPVLAALSLRSSGSTWRKQFSWAVIALAVGVGLSAIYIWVLLWQGYDPFFYLAPATAVQGQGIAVDVLLARIPENIAVLIELITFYFGVVGLPIALLSVAYLVWRRQFYLPLVAFIPMLILWISPRQNTRHLIVPTTLLLLCAALAIGSIIRYRPQRDKILVIAAILIWGFLSFFPFMATQLNNPAELSLLPADAHEYIYSEGSGFGLTEVRSTLKNQPVKVVIGMLSNCIGLKWISTEDFPVTCPNINPTGEDIGVLEVLMDENRTAGTYLVLEQSAYLPTTAPGELVATITRPGDGPSLSIYDLSPET
jgi:hypothetical protein